MQGSDFVELSGKHCTNPAALTLARGGHRGERADESGTDGFGQGGFLRLLALARLGSGGVAHHTGQREQRLGTRRGAVRDAGGEAQGEV